MGRACQWGRERVGVGHVSRAVGRVSGGERLEGGRAHLWGETEGRKQDGPRFWGRERRTRGFSQTWFIALITLF